MGRVLQEIQWKEHDEFPSVSSLINLHLANTGTGNEHNVRLQLMKVLGDLDLARADGQLRHSTNGRRIIQVEFLLAVTQPAKQAADIARGNQEDRNGKEKSMQS
jgi:hypothetical protein